MLEFTQGRQKATTKTNIRHTNRIRPKEAHRQLKGTHRYIEFGGYTVYHATRTIFEALCMLLILIRCWRNYCNIRIFCLHLDASDYGYQFLQEDTLNLSAFK